MDNTKRLVATLLLCVFFALASILLTGVAIDAVRVTSQLQYQEVKILDGKVNKSASPLFVAPGTANTVNVALIVEFDQRRIPLRAFFSADSDEYAEFNKKYKSELGSTLGIWFDPINPDRFFVEKPSFRVEVGFAIFVISLLGLCVYFLYAQLRQRNTATTL